MSRPAPGCPYLSVPTHAHPRTGTRRGCSHRSRANESGEERSPRAMPAQGRQVQRRLRSMSTRQRQAGLSAPPLRLVMPTANEHAARCEWLPFQVPRSRRHDLLRHVLRSAAHAHCRLCVRNERSTFINMQLASLNKAGDTRCAACH